jgi:hypothetical protein
MHALSPKGARYPAMRDQASGLGDEVHPVGVLKP